MARTARKTQTTQAAVTHRNPQAATMYAQALATMADHMKELQANLDAAQAALAGGRIDWGHYGDLMGVKDVLERAVSESFNLKMHALPSLASTDAE